MKTANNIRILLFSFSILFAIGFLGKVNAQPGVTVSFQQFYDELSPYGEWIDDPDYGYIWVPNVEPDFQPYATNGRWVMTDYGNTWVSNYNWGWAPFHYGRWNYNQRFGWSWVPGYEWGPAWVSWRSGGGYYGWAPLGPGLSIGVSVNIPSTYWIFVPQRHILSASIHRYYAPRRTVVNVYNRTTIINNTYVYNNHRYYAGPRRTDIQRVTRSSVPVHRISNASRPGSGRINGQSLEIYRPNISKNERARPTRIASANSIRSESRSTNRNTGKVTGRTATASANRNKNVDRRPASTTRAANVRANDSKTRNNEIRAKESNQALQARTNNTAKRPSAERSARPAAQPNRNSVQRSERSSAKPSAQTRTQNVRQSRSSTPSRGSERSSRSQDRPTSASRSTRG
ncbi:DUF6600 domain-containing protein [Olivibacter sp. XZL3]|uniref:DUF6600 domain-containing protein n=1 Tax=Olivibacter sp. XZL3 TaxID=1735116 RepID=UPI0010653E47|nr:DUF6600 domain-containing protein [Olivibacter sp. XZL3]